MHSKYRLPMQTKKKFIFSKSDTKSSLTSSSSAKSPQFVHVIVWSEGAPWTASGAHLGAAVVTPAAVNEREHAAVLAGRSCSAGAWDELSRIDSEVYANHIPLSLKYFMGSFFETLRKFMAAFVKNKTKNASKWPAWIKLLLQMGRLDSSTFLSMCMKDKKVNVSEIEWYRQNNVTK